MPLRLKSPDEIFGFHVQQAAEKLVQGLDRSAGRGVSADPQYLERPVREAPRRSEALLWSKFRQANRITAPYAVRVSLYEVLTQVPTLN